MRNLWLIVSKRRLDTVMLLCASAFLKPDHFGVRGALGSKIGVAAEHELVELGVALAWGHLEMRVDPHASYLRRFSPWHLRKRDLVALFLQLEILVGANRAHRCRRPVVARIQYLSTLHR